MATTTDVNSDAAWPGMRWIPGGTFRKGPIRLIRGSARPHCVTVSGFWVDEYTVTNAEFAAFVEEIGPGAPWHTECARKQPTTTIIETGSASAATSSKGSRVSRT